MKPLNFISLIAFFLFSTTVSAEYRVYQYYVKSKMERFNATGNYLVTSTLDPTSYLSYHGGNEAIAIDLLRTWTCRGYTGGMNEHCKAPLEESKLLQDERSL